MTAIVEVHNDPEPLVAEWECLAGSVEASPFLWPGWIGAWWRAFGTGQLQILTLRENGQVTGVLPLRKFSGALLSTTNPHTPLFGLLATTDTVRERLVRALFAQRPRHLGLSYLDPEGADVALVRAVADTARYRVFAESTKGAPYVATDGSWDAYEKGLRRKFRSEIRRRRRRLEEEGRLTLEVSDGTENLDELLEEGFRVEGSGWKDDYGTSIRSGSATRHFYTEVARWAARRGWLRLAFLRLDGQTLAFDYALEYNKTHYLLKTGYDPAYAKFAPGMIIRQSMLARAFSSDIAIYDFLGIGSDWKREWTSAEQERLFLHMFAPTATGFLDRAVFVGRRGAKEGAKSFARNSPVGERALHLLKRGRGVVHARLDR
jgi:CelD/BcsL family acetyltransferase involved in cellulose biosynthesis